MLAKEIKVEQNINFPKRLLELAKVQGEKEALVWLQGVLTYAELAKAMDFLATGLQNLGLKKGDRVALQLLNAPEFVISFYAILRFGGVVVPLNPLYTARELEIIMADSGAKALITATPHLGAIEGIRASLPEFRHLILTDGERQPDRILLTDLYSDGILVFPEPDENELAELIFTSGTTGRPKGAMLSHKNLYSNACLVRDEMQISQEERTLLVAPLFHIAAQTAFLNSTLIQGGTCYLLERWTKDDTVLQTIQNQKITYFFGVPAMYQFMLASPSFDNYDLSSLRKPFSGGAPLPVETFNNWREKTGVEIVEGYGLSETSPACTRNPYLGTKKPGSIGKAYPGLEVKIFDDQDCELPPGQVGEIVVRGSNVMMGYWNNPDATAEAMRNQWFHTGDMAYADDEGYIFIVDRKKDVIIRGGTNIYPREVEEVIYRFPGILEAAVIGIPDQAMGEEMLAFIALKNGVKINLEELREFCKQELIYYKVPKHFVILEQLPRNASGKILKTKLREIKTMDQSGPN
ncbi:MAG: long-chain fatty acid--CoA ligase [Clostridia bacterium]|nr:long-chain fatty acid--CoA ligase [Clostridia bacterium]